MIDRAWVRIRCVAGVVFIILVGGPFKMTKAEWRGIWTMFVTGKRVPRPRPTDARLQTEEKC